MDFLTIIADICSEQGIHMTELSFGWILRLEKDAQIRHIVGRNFDLNTEAGALIACDKYACYEALREGGVPVIEHRMLFNPLKRSAWIDEDGVWTQALAYFEEFQKVVVKPNDGWQGRGVYLCETRKSLERAIATLFATDPCVCICPFYEIIHEYRVFYLQGTCLLTYGKERPYVTGDGISDLQTLAAALNLSPDNLRFGQGGDFIPEKGERVAVAWKHNLSGGAESFEITDSALLEKLHSLAQKAAHNAHIAFATVDIAQMPDGSLAVMEINAGVAVKQFLAQHPDRYEAVRDIYARAISAMFERK